MTETLTLAHSPDADDLVMFWPLVGLTDAEGRPVPGAYEEPRVTSDRFGFELRPDDVEALNRRAIETGDLDITAISAHAYPRCRKTYRITATGGSFGEGYGPKVIARKHERPGGTGVPPVRSLSDLKGRTVAVPGLHTTAYLTLRLLAGEGFTAEPLPFMDIAPAVESGRYDAGVLIHEAQLTVDASDALTIVADLGQEWDKAHGLPLPLGLNVVKRDLDERFGRGTVVEVARLLEDSVRFAVEHAGASREFLRLRAGDRPEWADEALVKKYLSMYVSGLTVHMGERGRGALETLYARAHAAGLIDGPVELDIVGM